MALNVGTLTLNNLRITNFKSGQSGGAILVGGVTLNINDSHFYGNSGNSGGVLRLQSNSTVHIKRSAFYNNSASNNGGVINASGTMTITNSSFFNNTADEMGGVILIASSANSVTMNQVTMFNNTAKNNRWSLPGGAGGGIVDAKGGAAVTLRHSIVYGNNPNDCTRDADGGTSVMGTNVNNFIGASHCGAGSGNSNANPDLAGPGVHGLGNFYIPRANSPVIDKSGVSCLASTIAGYNEDQRKISRPIGSTCDIGAIEHSGYVPPPPPPPPTQIPAPPPASEIGGPGGGSGDGDGDGDGERSVDGFEYSAPPPSTCLTLDGIAAYNLSESTQCQRVDAVGIANPAIQQGDFVDAVDVWSWVMPDTRVCFEAAGSAFKFIDTAAMPRTVQDLPACSLNGMTCAAIDGIGILALLPGEAPSTACAVPLAQATPIPARSLSGCMVRTNYALNMRDAPAGAKIGGLPYDVTLTALARTVGWIKVDYHGEQGWIAAMYVEPVGTCD